MNQTVNRKDITEELYRTILDTEIHHDHQIIEDENGTYRWKRDDSVRKMVDKIGLNDIFQLFDALGLTKNSELMRKMYRDMGYSLYGYWEIFYWYANNPDANKYSPYSE